MTLPAQGAIRWACQRRFDQAGIGYAESQAFERIHEDSYRRLGFDLVDVPAGTVAERAAAIDAHIRSWA